MKRSDFLRPTAIIALALSALATCVPLVEDSGLPCPCTTGYVCCTSTQTCVPDGGCPEASEGGSSSGGKGGSSSGRGGATSGGVPAQGGAPASAGAAGDDAGGSVSSGGEAGAGGTTIEGGGAGGEGGEIVPGECSNYARTSNVLVLVYSPILQSGIDLQTQINARDGRRLSAELAAHLTAASGGVVNYNIVEARIVNQWPPQLPGTQPLDEATWNGQVYDDVTYVRYPNGNADYGVMFADQDVCYSVLQEDVSEVWLWGPSNNGDVSFGFDTFSYRLASDELPAGATAEEVSAYESRRRNIPDCFRTLWVQSGWYSAAYDAETWAKHFYNVRVREVLGWALRTNATDAEAAAARWAEFSSYERDGTPDLANIGTPDRPPNAGVYDDLDQDGTLDPVADWDFDDVDHVYSGANLWLNYPDLEGDPEFINCSVWGCSRDGFQDWYLAHVPHYDGESPNGTCNSWWKYFADPDGDLTPCPAGDCSGQRELGQPCASDLECATGYCACQGGTLGTWAACSETPGPLCRTTGWLACNAHEDCRSEVCGCHDGQPPKVCLPDAGYPTECTK